MRLIDADTLKKKIREDYHPMDEIPFFEIMHIISNAETIISLDESDVGIINNELIHDTGYTDEEYNELFENDTVYLLGIEGKVVFECGAWGWASFENCVPWDELEKRIPNNNSPAFVYNDNFVSFWELKWNFDNGDDWNGVPYIKKESKSGAGI